MFKLKKELRTWNKDDSFYLKRPNDHHTWDNNIYKVIHPSERPFDTLLIAYTEPNENSITVVRSVWWKPFDEIMELINMGEWARASENEANELLRNYQIKDHESFQNKGKDPIGE